MSPSTNRTMHTMRIGILALQGAVEPHRAKLAALRVENPGPEGLSLEAPLVRSASELDDLDGLILPGGESTTFLKLIGHYDLMAPLRAFAETRPVWGVCAGSILMAETVENPSQDTLSIMPITVRRNIYGRQNESFIDQLELRLPGQSPVSQEGVFIRAPGVTAWGDDVQVMGEYAGQPVALQWGRHLVTTFHPELSEADTLHRHFADLCRSVKDNGKGRAM